MAKKKKVKKKRVVKRKSIKRTTGASPKSIKRSRAMSPRSVRSSSRKIKLAFRNLLLFVIISLLSFLLGGIATNKLLADFFLLLGMITSFIAVAFLIVILVFALLRIMGR